MTRHQTIQPPPIPAGGLKLPRGVTLRGDPRHPTAFRSLVWIGGRLVALGDFDTMEGAAEAAAAARSLYRRRAGGLPPVKDPHASSAEIRQIVREAVEANRVLADHSQCHPVYGCRQGRAWVHPGCRHEHHQVPECMVVEHRVKCEADDLVLASRYQDENGCWQVRQEAIDAVKATENFTSVEPKHHRPLPEQVQLAALQVAEAQRRFGSVDAHVHGGAHTPSDLRSVSSSPRSRETHPAPARRRSSRRATPSKSDPPPSDGEGDSGEGEDSDGEVAVGRIVEALPTRLRWSEGHTPDWMLEDGRFWGAVG